MPMEPEMNHAPQDQQAPGLLLPILAILTAVLMWGGSFTAGKVAVNALGPIPMVWARMVVSLLALLPFYKKLRPQNYRKGDWKILLPLVLFHPCLYFVLEANALRYTTSSMASVVAATMPLLACVGARIFFKESIALLALCGLVLSVLSVVVLTLASSPSQSASAPLLGNLLEFLAMFSAAGYVLLTQKAVARYSSWTITFLQTLAGVIFFAPGAPVVLAGLANWPWRVWVSILYLGAGAFMLAFVLYNWAISRVPASRASAFVNLVPVVAVMLGWGILGETLNGIQFIAGCGVIAGVFISQLGRGKTP
jgi:drug/metabolite transporter (DMT)-like permease